MYVLTQKTDVRKLYPCPDERSIPWPSMSTIINKERPPKFRRPINQKCVDREMLYPHHIPRLGCCVYARGRRPTCVMSPRVSCVSHENVFVSVQPDDTPHDQGRVTRPGYYFTTVDSCVDHSRLMSLEEVEKMLTRVYIVMDPSTNHSINRPINSRTDQPARASRRISQSSIRQTTDNILRIYINQVLIAAHNTKTNFTVNSSSNHQPTNQPINPSANRSNRPTNQPISQPD